MAEEIKILAATCTGHYLFPKESWERGLSWNPDAIVAQGTTSDCGPSYIGLDAPYRGYAGIVHGLRTIILSAKKKGIPFIISTGTPGGGNRQLERSLGWVNDIAKEAGLTIKAAVIPGELDKEYLKQKIRSGSKMRRLVPSSGLPEYLSEEDVEVSTRIAAQMGPEPIMKALDMDVDGVITGRALDVGLHMALPLKRGFDKALTTHMAKTVECGGLVIEPMMFDSVFAVLREDYFLVRPTSPSAKCTTVSVVSHSFYERANPNREENPGGVLDISNAKYEQYDEHTVKVSGSRWIPAPYTLKVEGVRLAGYRTISICGIRDERMISCIDSFLEDTRRYTEEKLRPLKPNVDYQLIFRVYGKNGVLGEAEPIKQTKSHELGLIIEGVATKEEVADDVCEAAEYFVLHMPYPGRLSNAANVAVPYSPMEYGLGPIYVYHIWHLLELDDPCEPFKIEVREFPGK
jgi:hypothetical protein